MNVINQGDLDIEETAQVQMSIDGAPPELVNIIGSLSAGESASFAFTRALAPGIHEITFTVGDSATTISVNVEAGDINATPVPTPTRTGRLELIVTATPIVTPAPEPTATATAQAIALVYPTPTSTPMPTVTHTPIPTQTPIPPTRIPTHTPVPPSPTNTPESENLLSRFFKSTKDLTEANNSSQPNIDIGELETLVHNLINRERVQRGLAALQWDEEIAAIARNHSVDMGDKNYFSHTNRDGLNATDRGANAGYDCVKDYGDYYTFGLAENIHQGWLFSSTTYINGVAFYNWNSQEEIAARAVNGWMGSQGHRKNILKDTYDRTGIGIGITSEGKVFITQNFC